MLGFDTCGATSLTSAGHHRPKAKRHAAGADAFFLYPAVAYESKQTSEVDEYGMYIYKWTEALKYVDYLHSQPKGFDSMGRVGVSKSYVRHLAKFSQMINSNQSFTEVMKAAEKVSPSVRYYLLAEYCKRNVGNLPQNVKDQCSAIKKELKDVILFPKEVKGQSQVMRR